MTDLPAYAALLRAAGWTVTPPPAAEIPRVAVGQVWRSPKARVEDRTVVSIGPTRLIDYLTPRWKTACMTHESNFVAWARKSGARPVEE